MSKANTKQKTYGLVFIPVYQELIFVRKGYFTVGIKSGYTSMADFDTSLCPSSS